MASFRRSPVVFLSSEVTPVCHLSIHLLPSVSRSFLVVSLSDFAAGLVVYPLLCPVRALRIFPDWTASVQYRPCRLFVSALPVSGSFCDRGFVSFPGGVHAAGAARLTVSPIRTHGFRGLSTSVAFLRDGCLLCLFYLCFLCFFVLCVSQPKKSRGIMLYGHMKCRVPWVPP